MELWTQKQTPCRAADQGPARLIRGSVLLFYLDGGVAHVSVAGSALGGQSAPASGMAATPAMVTGLASKRTPNDAASHVAPGPGAPLCRVSDAPQIHAFNFG